MAQLADNELAELGRDAARQLVGADTVKAVEVKAGFNSSVEPAYHVALQELRELADHNSRAVFGQSDAIG